MARSVPQVSAVVRPASPGPMLRKAVNSRSTRARFSPTMAFDRSSFGRADLVAEAEEEVGLAGVEDQLLLVGGDPVQLREQEGPLVVGQRPLGQQQDAAGAVEVVAEVLDVLELDLVEDAELVGALEAVVAVAQEGRDVAVDEVVLDLALDEHLPHQPVDPQVELALREVDVELREDVALVVGGVVSAGGMARFSDGRVAGGVVGWSPSDDALSPSAGGSACADEAPSVDALSGRFWSATAWPERAWSEVAWSRGSWSWSRLETRSAAAGAVAPCARAPTAGRSRAVRRRVATSAERDEQRAGMQSGILAARGSPWPVGVPSRPGADGAAKTAGNSEGRGLTAALGCPTGRSAAQGRIRREAGPR